MLLTKYAYIILTERQINQCQIRKWCSNLQTGYNNLKLWGSWLDETCKMVTKLEQNKGKKYKIDKHSTLANPLMIIYTYIQPNTAPTKENMPQN